MARQARIQGTVRFAATVTAGGKIRNTALLSGHPLLLQAAKQAAGQCVYWTTSVDGRPAEGVATIDVEFSLPGDAAEAARSELPPVVYRIAGGLNGPVPIHRAEPLYPPELLVDGEDGVVMLGIVFNGDGNVATAEPAKGELSFFEAALEAVRQWKFKPAMKDGQPVSVKANVEVNFRRNRQ